MKSSIDDIYFSENRRFLLIYQCVRFEEGGGGVEGVEGVLFLFSVDFSEKKEEDKIRSDLMNN